MLIHITSVFLLLAATVCANTEKVIFLGPATVNIPSTHPTLDDLHVDTLTPANAAVRTHLEAQFTNASSPYGKATWLVLDELTEGQRYEVRVCWAATVSKKGVMLQGISIKVKYAYESPATYRI